MNRIEFVMAVAVVVLGSVFPLSEAVAGTASPAKTQLHSSPQSGKAMPLQNLETSFSAMAAKENPSLRVYPLDCGRIRIKDMDMFADDGSYKGVSAQLVVSCYLIRHPKGDLLWDTGIGDQFTGPKGVELMPGNVAYMPVTLRSQLAWLGTRPGKIRYLAFSHEHIDHIGNANLMTGAIWLLNPKEHQWTVREEGHDGAPPALLAESTKAKIQWVKDDYDVFGDGTVRILQTPGHTPGHQSLFVRPSGEQPLILAGDVWHSRVNFLHNRVPRFNTSRSQTIASMQLLRDLARKTGARIVIGHAPEDFAPLNMGR
ncbi:lactamase [Advenella kashmirensis W13003]|uniref:Lactamase n=1 Tax=Advenella kashmirensis W13003 TaxID=1424334 RepID=V8QVC8_9BURK|nr:N-acyl homoserine lactonase family protein [Advenella kashmirensis]ETF02954.1 lactamase [Advenella kashmirensis W13003]